MKTRFHLGGVLPPASPGGGRAGGPTPCNPSAAIDRGMMMTAPGGLNQRRRAAGRPEDTQFERLARLPGSAAAGAGRRQAGRLIIYGPRLTTATFTRPG